MCGDSLNSETGTACEVGPSTRVWATEFPLMRAEFETTSESAGQSVELPKARAHELRVQLCAWFAAHRRELPWRHTRDPYAIWVSEAMLQQTRVETVIPYWERFLERLPTIEALARADEEELLALWSGLGYYRRARSLKEAAIAIRERFDGQFPDLLEDALSLPGIGPYTAGAVLSIAYDLPVAAVDGNVLRVFARLFALSDPWGSSALSRKVWKLAESWMSFGQSAQSRDLTGPGAWNQGLMELGATICTAKNPRCGECPWSAHCEASARGVTDRFPVPGPKREYVGVELESLVIVADGRVLLQQRPPGGRMAGLFECPTRELTNAGESSRLFPAEFALPDPEARLVGQRELAELRHSITNHRIRARILVGEAELLSAAQLDPTWRWVRPEDADSLALSGMTAKLLKKKAVRDFLSEPANR